MEIHGSSSAVALLGLEDLVVLAATEVDGELHQLIETTADRVGCPSCGVLAVPPDIGRTGTAMGRCASVRPAVSVG